MMQTEDDARRNVVAIGASIRDTLIDRDVAYVRWEPGNGTGYEFMFIPWEATTDIGSPMFAAQGAPGWVTIARFYSDAVYPVRLWELDGTGRMPDPDYCAEKWAKGSKADGCAIHILLAAIVGLDPWCSFEDADIEVSS